MNKETKLEKWAQAGLLLAIIVALLPFWALAGFNHPSGDNFCYTNVFNDPDITGVIDGVIDWRRRWNGRYFALFLMGNYFVPFDMIATYRYPPLVLFACWWLAGYYLLCGLTGFSDSRLRTAAVALGLCALYTLTMPLVSNGFYHVTGAFQYQAGNILTMAALGCLLRISVKPNRYGQLLLGAALVFAAVGCTELHMVFMVILVSAITLYGYWTRSPARHAWTFLLLVTLLSAAFLILAPGNETRGQHFPARHQLWFSISESLVQLGVWTAEWLRQPLLWLATLAYLAWLLQHVGRSVLLQRVRLAQLVIGAVCLLGSLLACFFVAYWAMGVSLPGRALNVVHFIFLLGWFGLVSFGVGLWKQQGADWSKATSRRAGARITGVVVALAMAAGLVSAKSVRIAYTDLTQRASSYDEFFRARYDQIEIAAKEHADVVRVLAVKPQDRPRTIMVDDIRSDRRNFRNECYATYFGIRAIEVVREKKFWVKSAPVLSKPVDDSGLSIYAQYVLAYDGLTKAWVKSGKDISQWGERHWIRRGKSAGRSISPVINLATPNLILTQERDVVADRVSCATNDARADGLPDLVFSVDMKIPPDAGPLSAITHMRLNRFQPRGIYETNDGANFLGISYDKKGPLLNNANGRMQVKDPSSIKRLWLFACADRLDQTGTIYQIKALFRRDLPE